MKCYECKWLDRSVILTSSPPQYGCTLGFGSHYADHECEYDFMPIVRCRDCRWWNEDDFPRAFPEKKTSACECPNIYGANFSRYTDEDEFCSRGVRKGGDDK